MPFPYLHPKMDNAGPSWTWLSGSPGGVAPGTVVLDTGQLSSGAYEALVMWVPFAGLTSLVLEHRNAANTVTLRFIPGANSPTVCEDKWIVMPRYTLNTNERLRVTIITAANPSLYTLFYRKVA